MHRLAAALLLFTVAALLLAAAPQPEPASLIAPGATLLKLGDGYRFTEGPAADTDGNVVFSDVPAAKRYRWTLGGKVTLLKSDTHNANGQMYDAAGNLLVCEHATHSIVSIAPSGEATVLASEHQGKPLNRTNDLWIDPKGGVYFTDAVYGKGERPQGGEHVYYITPGQRRVIRVVDDMVRPNGLIGTPDGKTLYIADHGGSKTFRYAIQPDGTLSGKALFATRGSDGMTIDSQGNVYLTDDAVYAYAPDGAQLARIETPKPPANVCFAGKDRKLLFITARDAVYGIRMAVRGVDLETRGKVH